MDQPSFLDLVRPRLNDAQFAAVSHRDGPLLVLAGAGSGKTRVITYRVAALIRQWGVPAYRILAVTFTNKAADEMRHRIESLLTPEEASAVHMGTFHAVCARMLRANGSAIDIPRDFTIYDSSDQKVLMDRILKAHDIDPRQVASKVVLNIISGYKTRLETPAMVAAQTAPADPVARHAALLYGEYQQELRRNNALDFGDLIMEAVRMLTESPEAGEFYNARWPYILVDEFQDTNKAQLALLKALTKRQQNICVVGDDDQSIYSWRGAEVRNILQFEDLYPAASTVSIERNYRSSSQILACANAVISGIDHRHPKKLWTDRDDGRKPLVMQCDNPWEEARFVTAELSRVKSQHGVDYRDQAVFYRTNFQSRVFEDVFRESGIPYQVVGGIRFYDRKEIKDISSYLRLAVTTRDDVALSRIINTPARGIGLETQRRLTETAAAHGASLYQAIDLVVERGAVARGAVEKLLAFKHLVEDLQAYFSQHRNPAHMAAYAYERSGYQAMLEGDTSVEAESRKENIQELLVIMEEYGDKGLTLPEIIETLALRSDADEMAQEDAVTLMTVHAAKGLEFDTVFLTGMEEGIFPHSLSLFEPRQLEEERRLCYVGMTRAMQRLYLSWCQERPHFSSNGASRFLLELDPDLADFKGDLPLGHHHRVMGGYEPLESSRPFAAASRQGRGFSFATPSRRDDDQGPPVKATSMDGLERFRPARPGRPETGATTYAPKLITPEMIRRGDPLPIDRHTRPVIETPQEPTGVAREGEGRDFPKGGNAYHPEFGVGRVMSVKGSGAEAVVQVAFPGRPSMKLKARFLKPA